MVVRRVGVRKEGVRRVGVRKEGVRRVGVRRVGVRRVGVRRVGEPKFRAFFPLSRRKIRSSFLPLSWGLFGNFGVFEAPGP